VLYLIASLELWLRIFLRREAPDALGEQLAAEIKSLRRSSARPAGAVPAVPSELGRPGDGTTREGSS
jgi:hypothetical protein